MRVCNRVASVESARVESIGGEGHLECRGLVGLDRDKTLDKPADVGRVSFLPKNQVFVAANSRGTGQNETIFVTRAGKDIQDCCVLHEASTESSLMKTILNKE